MSLTLLILFIAFYAVEKCVQQVKRDNERMYGTGGATRNKPSVAEQRAQKRVEQYERKLEREQQKLRDNLSDVLKKEVERESKEEFSKAQAEFDLEFLQRHLDEKYKEYWSIEEDINLLQEKIEQDKQANKYEAAAKRYREIERLKKKLSTADTSLHAIEKKIRAAQYKAGREITS